MSDTNHWRARLEPLEERMLLAAVSWTIVEAESFSTITIPDQPFELTDGTTTYSGTLRIRDTSGNNGGPWSVGNTANMAGTIASEYTDGSSIQFLLGQSDINGVNSGNYIPNPANWNGTDFGGSFDTGPGVFGGRLRPSLDQALGLTLDVGYFNLTDIEVGLGSSSLAITAGSFPANTTDIGIASAIGNVKGISVIIVGQVLPDAQEAFGDLLTVNQAATGTITSPDPINQPQLRRLTLPILQAFNLQITPETPPFFGTISGQLVAEATLPEPGFVTGRHLFYNQSGFDGNSAALEPADDGAIATDKTAYLPGSGIANFESVSSFSRGVNGIMIDIGGGGNHTAINTADFVFKVGNNNSPDTWSAAPAPSSITVRTGAGVSGADRIEIAWATGDVKNQWLEVQVLATENTGLTSPDVHFWGNRTGDSGTGTPATIFQTTSADAAQVFGNLTGTAAIDNLRDYNRSGNVTSADAAQVFNNLGTIVRIDIGGGGPFGPEGDAGDGGAEAAIASALAAPVAGQDAEVPATAMRVDPVDDSLSKNPPKAAAADAPTELRPTSRTAKAGDDSPVVDLALDVDLLDSLSE